MVIPNAKTVPNLRFPFVFSGFNGPRTPHIGKIPGAGRIALAFDQLPGMGGKGGCK